VSGGAFPRHDPHDDAAQPASPRARLLYVLLVVVALGGAALLFTFDPAAGGLYPPCVFHRYTGLHCPGCGSTRGLHALLHGQVWAAFRYNALMVLALPFLAAAFVRHTRRVFGSQTAHPRPRRVLRPGWIWSLFVLVIAYWVLRNLPFRPFVWLAPTDVSPAQRSQAPSN
jgi:hypothetical protein